MNYRAITVFGGTGFLGRRVVWHLRKREFTVRIASRHPERGKKLFGGVGLRNASESSHHSESSGTNAARHSIIAGAPWICRTWNFTALGRGDTPAYLKKLLIQKASCEPVQASQLSKKVSGLAYFGKASGGLAVSDLKQMHESLWHSPGASRVID
jgi:hypothetical protein